MLLRSSSHWTYEGTRGGGLRLRPVAGSPGRVPPKNPLFSPLLRSRPRGGVAAGSISVVGAVASVAVCSVCWLRREDFGRRLEAVEERGGCSCSTRFSGESASPSTSFWAGDFSDGPSGDRTSVSMGTGGTVGCCCASVVSWFAADSGSAWERPDARGKSLYLLDRLGGGQLLRQTETRQRSSWDICRYR